MSILFIAEVPVQQDRLKEYKTYISELLPASRAYEGCKSIEIYEDEDSEGVIFFIEQWESRAHQEKYLAWRAESGVLGKLGTMVESAPRMRYLHRTSL
jgi:quinol monooxygenase YgiN